MRKLGCILFCILISSFCSGQQLDLLGTDRWIQTGGNLSLSNRFYNSSVSEASNQLGLVGRYTVTAAGIAFPFSISYRQSGGSFSHPFNRFTIAPSYKWASLQVGTTSMFFSPYTLAGLPIDGVGLQLAPGSISLSMVYGKMRNFNIIEPQDETEVLILDSYDRKATGLKIGYVADRIGIELMGLKVKDSGTSADSLSRPADNLVIGSTLSVALIKNLRFKVNAAASGITNDLETQDLALSDQLESINSLLEINASSRLNFAGDASIDYNQSKWGLGLRYKRIEPLFESLGTSFFLTDVSQYKWYGNINLIKNKLRLSGSFGVEQNNIKNNRLENNTRTIGSLSVILNAAKNLQFTANYFNYQKNSEPNLVEFSDTLRYTVVTKTGYLSTRIGIYNTSTSSHSLLVSGNWQRINDQSPIQNLGTDILNTGFSIRYQVRYKPLKLNSSIGWRFSSLDLLDRTRSRFGLLFNASKPLIDEKLRTSFSANYFFNDIDGKRDGTNFRLMSRLGYALNKRMRLSLNVIYTSRALILSENRNEWRGSTSISQSF